MTECSRYYIAEVDPTLTYVVVYDKYGKMVARWPNGKEMPPGDRLRIKGGETFAMWAL